MSDRLVHTYSDGEWGVVGSRENALTVEVFIPWADDGSPERRHALGLVLDFYAEEFPAWPCRIAEATTRFPRAVACNEAAAASTAEVVIFNDADSIGEPAAILAGVSIARMGGLARCYDHYLRLSERSSAACRDWRDVRHGEVIWEQRNTVSQGIAAFNRRTFLRLGGYDPRFRYFYDDDAFDYVAGQAGTPLERVQGSLWHLWHLSREPFPEDEVLRARYQTEDAALVRAEAPREWSV